VKAKKLYEKKEKLDMGLSTLYKRIKEYKLEDAR